MAELERSLEIDLRFALARMDLAWIGFFSGGTRIQARETIRRAAQDAKRAPDKEARLVRILAAFFDGRFAAARTEIHSAMSRYPEDRDVTVTAAEVLSWSGYYEDAALAFQRAFRLAPEWDVLWFDQVLALNYLGRGGEALSFAEQVARQRRTLTARAVLGVARLLSGDTARAITALEEGSAAGALHTAFLAEGLAADGKIEEALQVVEKIGEPAAALMTRAQVLAYGGRLREGLQSMERAAHQPGADVAFNRQVTAWYLAAAGQLPRARDLTGQGEFFIPVDGVMLAMVGDGRRLGELLAQLGPEPGVQGRFLHALATYAAGNRQAALRELREVDRGTVSFVPYFHGVLAAEAGQDEEAVEALRRFVKASFGLSDAYQAPWFGAHARLLLARSLGRMGNRREAREVLDRALLRWKDADADLPLLTEMKVLRAQLDGSPAAR